MLRLSPPPLGRFRKWWQFFTRNGQSRAALYRQLEIHSLATRSVDRGSPAALAGLMPRNAIVNFGGQDAAGMRLHALRLLLCSEGKKIELAVRRGAEENRVSLTLREWRQDGTGTR
jgi:C-terminal processing protease CtpA/Prc